MKIRSLLSLTALAVTLPAAAVDARLYLAGGPVVNQGSTLDLTNRRTGGFNLEGGFLFAPKDFGPQIEVYAGLLRIPGGNPSADHPTYELDGPHLGANLVYRPWDRLNALSLRIGPCLHVWQVNQKGTEGSGNQGDQNLKLGWRTGLAYDLGANWGVSVSYTFSEWRSNSSLPYQQGVNPSRPAYLTLMASYRF